MVSCCQFRKFNMDNGVAKEKRTRFQTLLSRKWGLFNNFPSTYISLPLPAFNVTFVSSEHTQTQRTRRRRREAREGERRSSAAWSRAGAGASTATSTSTSTSPPRTRPARPASGGAAPSASSSATAAAASACSPASTPSTTPSAARSWYVQYVPLLIQAVELEPFSASLSLNRAVQNSGHALRACEIARKLPPDQP